MRRWTDGKSWSASRVSGSFLTYREMEGKRGGGNFLPAPRRMNGKTPDSGRGSDEDMDVDGEGPDGYRYKPDGLMKQSFSITTSQGQHLHLISYYSRPNANQQELMQPTQDPALKHILPLKGMYPESTVHEQAQGPVTTRTPMQNNPYIQVGHPLYRQAHPFQLNQPYWPPSPVATPPHSYHVGIYALPPPPAHAHNSCHPYMQHQIYDRQEHSLPQPPPPQQRQMIMPPSSYAPNPSPRLSQAKLMEQQAQRLSQQQQQMPIDPRIIAQPLIQHHQYPQTCIISGPHQQQDQGPGQSQSQMMYGHAPAHNGSPQGSPRDQANASHPMMNGHRQQLSPPPPSSGRGNGQSPAHTPPRGPSRPHTPPPPVSTPNAPATLKNDASSSGTSIPSISSLINHSEDPSKLENSRSNDSGSSRSGSRSPNDSGRATDAACGEDARAIRVLDAKMWI